MHILDTGVGILSEDIPKLFSQFGKLHRTAEINNDGIGLGLTIVKQIVEEASGKVTVESAGPNCGSRFIFHMKMKKSVGGRGRSDLTNLTLLNNSYLNRSRSA